jgi:hypothetical protein
MAEKASDEAEEGGGSRSMTHCVREERASASPPVEGTEGVVGRSARETKTSLRSERVIALGGTEGADATVGFDVETGGGRAAGRGVCAGFDNEGAGRLKLNLGLAAACDLREARRSWRDLSSCGWR